jgi:hypothetical protein
MKLETSVEETNSSTNTEPNSRSTSTYSSPISSRSSSPFPQHESMPNFRKRQGDVRVPGLLRVGFGGERDENEKLTRTVPIGPVDVGTGIGRSGFGFMKREERERDDRFDDEEIEEMELPQAIGMLKMRESFRRLAGGGSGDGSGWDCERREMEDSTPPAVRNGIKRRDLTGLEKEGVQPEVGQDWWRRGDTHDIGHNHDDSQIRRHRTTTPLPVWVVSQLSANNNGSQSGLHRSSDLMTPSNRKNTVEERGRLLRRISAPLEGDGKIRWGGVWEAEEVEEDFGVGVGGRMVIDEVRERNGTLKRSRDAQRTITVGEERSESFKRKVSLVDQLFFRVPPIPHRYCRTFSFPVRLHHQS